MSNKSTKPRHRLKFKSVAAICARWQKRMKKLARKPLGQPVTDIRRECTMTPAIGCSMEGALWATR